MKLPNDISLSGSTSTAKYLAAYIVDLILVLHKISVGLTADPPRSLTEELVDDALAIYRSGSTKIHAQVKEAVISSKPEEKVAKVIWKALGVDMEYMQA